MKFGADEMRQRYAELERLRAAARERIVPYEDRRAQLAEEEARLRELRMAIRDEKLATVAETGIGRIEEEMAMIVRALNGKTGMPAA